MEILLSFSATACQQGKSVVILGRFAHSIGMPLIWYLALTH
jgi:hypothetical protein